MRVVAFVGKSGTGKSYRALWVAKENNINYIIDDGLLIGNNKVIAGTSAKKESSAMAATKRAIFSDQNHSQIVKKAINQHNPEAILIIATSDKMAERIRKELDLNQIEKTIYITDVATKQEIDKARQIRTLEGKHIIPVPTFELKKTFSGYFLDALKIFKKKGNFKFEAEKTIIRPSFSYLGRYVVSDRVIKQIAKHIATEEFGIEKVSVDIKNYNGSISITLIIVVKYEKLNRKIFSQLQNNVKEQIEKLTYMNVVQVNVLVRSLDV